MCERGKLGDHIRYKRFAIDVLVVSSSGRTDNQLIPCTTTSTVSVDDGTPTITIDEVMKVGIMLLLTLKTPTWRMVYGEQHKYPK